MRSCRYNISHREKSNNNNNNNNNSGKESETIQHITAACEQLAPTDYVKRHDGLANIIHQKLAEAAELIDDKVQIISTHQPVYWRMKISSCTGIAAQLRTKQYILIDRTKLL
jgi:hypothetical protein